MTYYRLTDREHKGIIVRAEGRNQQQCFPERGWVDSGIMLRYFWPDSEYYDSCEEIDETTALAAAGAAS